MRNPLFPLQYQMLQCHYSWCGQAPQSRNIGYPRSDGSRFEIELFNCQYLRGYNTVEIRVKTDKSRERESMDCEEGETQYLDYKETRIAGGDNTFLTGNHPPSRYPIIFPSTHQTSS
jgi:hypothetical protein